MKTITVTAEEKPKKPYNIIIGSHLLQKLESIVDLKEYSHIAIITDTNVAKYHLETLRSHFKQPVKTIIIPPGEKEKTIHSVEIIWKELAEAGFDRKSLVINLGGGVIGDMGGFAADTYMRGIAFINIPTTILAQVDESVGGKTGIDFLGIKNIIGTFQQPKAVIIDMATVATLPNREFTSGFAEIIKHGLIADKTYFEKVTAKKPRDFSEEELVAIITGSCEIKQKYVESDTHEKGLRRELNFGHTIGHAIESLSLQTDVPLLHGEAVSIGIAAEAKLSQLKGYLSEDDVLTIRRVYEHAGLPTRIKLLETENIINKMKSDKKSIAGEIKWTLLKHIGKASHDEEVSESQIREALDFILHE